MSPRRQLLDALAFVACTQLATASFASSETNGIEGVSLGTCRGRAKVVAVLDHGNGPEDFRVHPAVHSDLRRGGGGPGFALSACRGRAPGAVGQRACTEGLVVRFPLPEPDATGVFDCADGVSAEYHDTSTGRPELWSSITGGCDAVVDLRRNRDGKKLKGLFSVTLRRFAGIDDSGVHFEELTIAGCFNSKLPRPTHGGGDEESDGRRRRAKSR